MNVSRVRASSACVRAGYAFISCTTTVRGNTERYPQPLRTTMTRRADTNHARSWPSDEASTTPAVISVNSSVAAVIGAFLSQGFFGICTVDSLGASS